MHITQIRNATVILEFRSQDRDIVLLVDPMLAARNQLPSLRFLTRHRRRNPVVDLPQVSQSLLNRVTHALITHCQRGHFDHLDRVGSRFLRERQIPVFCSTRDAPYLAQRGLTIAAAIGTGTQDFFDGSVTTIPCVHGLGWVGRWMEHGVGYHLALPGEPSVYLAGDTVLTAHLENCLLHRKPHVCVLPAGGARFDLGADILMDAEQVCAAARIAPGWVIANHLEALDHCPVSRDELRCAAVAAGVAERLCVPADGERLTFEIDDRRELARLIA